MPRKKTTEVAPGATGLPPDPSGTGLQAEWTEGPTSTTPPSEPAAGNGNGEGRQPVYRVGPIPTDKDNAVTVAVWANEVQTRDGRTFTVHNVTVEARWRDAAGEWKSGKTFRGSQCYALIYCLQRASDWILAQRDPSNRCPF